MDIKKMVWSSPQSPNLNITKQKDKCEKTQKQMKSTERLWKILNAWSNLPVKYIENCVQVRNRGMVIIAVYIRADKHVL